MAELLIRPALAEDLDQLINIKRTYVRALYRGYSSQQELEVSQVNEFRAQLEEWLLSPKTVLDVAEIDGEVSGYACFGRDPEDEAFGLIHDIVMNITCSGHDRSLVVLHCVNKLREQDIRQVRVWLLRDNLRSRYLVEQLGFRPDGEWKEVRQGDEDMPFKRYLYREFP